MDKNKKKAIITAILVVIMAGNMFRVFVLKKKIPGAVQAGTPAISQQAMTDNLSFLATVRQSENARSLQEAYWAKAWARDPFAMSDSGGDSSGNPDNFILSGIVWDGRMPVAIVNEKLLKVNDEIGGCRVEAILHSSVKLACDERSYELRLFRSSDPSSGSEEKKNTL